MQSRKLEVRGVGNCKWATLFAGVLTIATVVPAQSPPSGPPITEPWPQEIGQWAGPWNLQQSMVRDPLGVAYDPAVTEIAHSMLIPPREPGLLGQSPYKGWVLFMNRRSLVEGGPNDGPQPTFLWNADEPGSIADDHHLYLYDGVSGNLALDVFCSGHTYLGDGRPATAGGQDNVNTSPMGQGQSYVLETRFADELNPPFWDLLGSEQAVERWYPTVTTLADGRLLQVGNTANNLPLVDPVTQVSYDCETSPFAHPACGDWFRSILSPDVQDPSGFDWGPELINRRNDAGAPACEGASPLEVSHYPRLHLLSSGELVWIDGLEQTGLREHVSYFLKVDP